jgi:hypothetical protein
MYAAGVEAAASISTSKIRYSPSVPIALIFSFVLAPMACLKWPVERSMSLPTEISSIVTEVGAVCRRRRTCSLFTVVSIYPSATRWTLRNVPRRVLSSSSSDMLILIPAHTPAADHIIRRGHRQLEATISYVRGRCLGGGPVPPQHGHPTPSRSELEGLKNKERLGEKLKVSGRGITS